MMKRALWASVLALMLVMAAGVSAQDEPLDVAASPNFAAVYLEAGFPLDPYLVRVESSGTVDAATVLEECSGVIPAVPDVVVNWSGEADQLTFFVYSDTDPTLLIVTPSGNILCNDDYSLDTLNPVVSIPSPEAGSYAVFVGAYDPAALAYGWLGVTQMSSEQLDVANADLSPMLDVRARPVAAAAVQRSVGELVASADPLFGADTLDAGFGEQGIAVTGAGTESVVQFALNSAECSGFINLVPSYRFTLSAETSPLSVFFNGDADSVLVVRQPDGSFVCNTNAADDNLNPALTLDNAAAGDYAVWVGTANPTGVATGTLVISEDAAQPAVLPAGQ